jgi:hypothetical protein
MKLLLEPVFPLLALYGAFSKLATKYCKLKASSGSLQNSFSSSTCLFCGSDLEISDLALSPTAYPHLSLSEGTNKFKVAIQGLSLSVSFVHLILCFQTECITSDFSVGL